VQEQCKLSIYLIKQPAMKKHWEVGC